MKPYSGPPMTLGNAAAAKVRLIVCCKACGYQAEPDIAAAAGAHGADLPVPDWRARLRCSRCDGRDVDFVVTGDSSLSAPSET